LLLKPLFEDTKAGIEAATAAGMVAVAIPNWMTKEQDFSKAKKSLIRLLSKPQVN
jgi:beta-phosphoglucomutase-like phosphatase (HAD superfamily)